MFFIYREITQKVCVCVLQLSKIIMVLSNEVSIYKILYYHLLIFPFLTSYIKCP